MATLRIFRIPVFVSVISLAMWAWCPQTASAASSAAYFRPVSPEELKMTAEPAAPGASAIILYREVYRDDNTGSNHEDCYFRIKILTEEGRKNADIEIPYDKDEGKIVNVHARTIKPDGAIADFDGNVFTKTIVKARGVKIEAKTLALPGVAGGSIIEYFYTLDIREQRIYDSHWIISHELFTKAADFSLKPYLGPALFYLTWIAQNMRSGWPTPVRGHDHIFRIHVADVPPFVTEDFMPPENEEKARVDFIYSRYASNIEPTRFWAELGKTENDELEKFVGKSSALQQAVGEIVNPVDTPEVKLPKLYARVQQMRNTSFEVQKTGAEEKREKEKPASNAEEVWKHGYGNGAALTWLYLALVRAAGFEAYGMMVPSRQHYFFYPQLMQGERLDENIVLIKLHGRTIYCDPGSAFTPFGLLPWMGTHVQGLQLDKKNPSLAPSLVTTSDQARTQRRAQLTLSETGDLEGTLTVTYTGLKAAQTRLEEQYADDTERRKFLEDTARSYTPAASEVKLTNQPEWKKSEPPLVAEFSFKLPGWGAWAGRHMVVPVGLFSARERHLFDHAERVHDIYFEYPFAELDDVDIQLPAGWKIISVPPGWKGNEKALGYNLTVQYNNGKLHLSRTLTLDLMLLDVQYYSSLRHIFQEIGTADDQQIVLDPDAPRAAN